ncbi:TesA Lysophospholipase L1 and related esterases [Burkholderiaceae bacterium]|jgi:acyl-CoA thioesterase-1
MSAVASPTSRLLVVGDSLSAEYGIARGTGWVALLDAQLQKDHPNWQVVNASISGDTTAGGLARLPPLLKQHQPQLVVIELGGNDALRGFSLKRTEDNLVKMIRACQAIKAKVLLVGMQVPPNYGAAYASDFTRLFARISKQQQTALVPFLLAGVADDKDPTALFQADRIHPKAEAHPRILANVWAVLKKML